MAKKEINNQRYQVLDMLRGLAAIAVVLYHYTFGYDNGLGTFSEERFYFKYGYLGVHLFFIISGFVIFMTLERTKTSLDFGISRFSRLFPTYWTAILFTVLVTVFITGPFYNSYTIKQVLINITMLQSYFKVEHVDGAYWSLTVELTFYVLMWILFVFKKMTKIIWFCYLWLLLAVFCANSNLNYISYVKVVLILKYAPLFVAGIAFYLLKKRIYKPIYLHILIASSLLAELYLLSLKNIDFVQYSIISGFYLIFYLFVYEKLEFTENKILIFLGSISYALYLIHQNVGVHIIYWAKKFLDYQLVYIPFTLIIVILMAHVITKFVEKPAIKLIRASYKKYKSEKQ